jgi:hypothetical protein
MESTLKNRIADAARVSRDNVHIYLHSSDCAELGDDGTLSDCPQVFGEVYWYAKERSQKVIDLIAAALQHFLNVHALGRGFDLKFFGFPAGSFYAEKGGDATLVLGGEALPPNRQIAQTVYHITGYVVPGVIEND